jgi:hypothetical protein
MMSHLESTAFVVSFFLGTIFLPRPPSRTAPRSRCSHLWRFFTALFVLPGLEGLCNARPLVASISVRIHLQSVEASRRTTVYVDTRTADTFDDANNPDPEGAN